jgi:hypothetical protein
MPTRTLLLRPFRMVSTKVFKAMLTEFLARSDRQQLNESRDFLDSEQNLANSPMVIFSRQRVGSRSKAICGRVSIARFLFGHPAHGWLRLSHRVLDASRRKPYQPIYSHQREQRLKAGKIVPVEIEIWPSSTIFRAGEQMRLLVMGKDPFPPSDGLVLVSPYTPKLAIWEGTSFTPAVVFDSQLLVPVILAK